MKCPPNTFTKEQRRMLLKKLVQNGSATEIARKLGISRASLYRYIKGEREIPGEIDSRLCMTIDEDELLALLNSGQLLEAAGLIRNDQVNTPLLIAIVDAALNNVQARDIILKRIATRYKTELQDLVSQTIPRIELVWNEDFERYLTEKKTRPISDRTLNDYRNIWHLCLQGKSLGWHVIRQIEANQMKCRDGEYHPTTWIRQVFRHYIRYLYSIGKLDWDTYSRLLLTIPGRKYGRKISQKPIDTNEIKRTLSILKEKREDIYTLYMLILYSTIRFEHGLRMLKNWNPQEKLYIPYLNRNISRLECNTVFCRYYLGTEESRKPVGFAYFPEHLLQKIEEHRNDLPGKRRIERVVKRLDGLMPKYIRIYALRISKTVFGETDTWRFFTSKFGELTVSARHYMDLIIEVDKVYPKYIQYVKHVLGMV